MLIRSRPGKKKIAQSMVQFVCKESCASTKRKDEMQRRATFEVIFGSGLVVGPARR